MAGIFGEFFLVSVSHETKHEKSSKNLGKIRSKIRGKIRDENFKNSGNFRSAIFLAWRFGYFLFVFLLGGGEGGVQATGTRFSTMRALSSPRLSQLSGLVEHTRLRVPPVALHVSQLISWIL